MLLIPHVAFEISANPVLCDSRISPEYPLRKNTLPATYRSPHEKKQSANSWKMEKKFGNILRQFRNSKGLSQEDLAERLEISRSHIGRLETGEKQPSLKMLFRLADALEIQASAIVEEMEKERHSI